MQLPRNRNREPDRNYRPGLEQARGVAALQRRHHDAHCEANEDVAFFGRMIVEKPGEETEQQPCRHSHPACRSVRVLRGRNHQHHRGADRHEQRRHVAHHQRRIRDEDRRQREQQRRNRRGQTPEPPARQHVNAEHRKHPENHRRVERPKIRAIQVPEEFQDQRVAAGIARRVSISTEMQYRTATSRQVLAHRRVLEPVRPRHQFESASQARGLGHRVRQRHDRRDDYPIRPARHQVWICVGCGLLR